MLSSQMLWPRSWSTCVAFIASPLFSVWLDPQAMRTHHHRDEYHAPDGSTPSLRHSAVRRPDRTAFPPCSAISSFPPPARERSFEPLVRDSGRPAVALSPTRRSMTRRFL